MNLWTFANNPTMDGNAVGICKVCGQPALTGLPFADWVRDTFTDHDKLKPGDIICHACQFMFCESSELLMRMVGKDKPQRMRNYSHFVVSDVWYPLSKGDKTRMKDYMFGAEFPQLVVIAESGQKHILFRAMWNNAKCDEYGYIQFEEQGAFIDRQQLKSLLDPVEELYTAFNKEAILTGNYNTNFILKRGCDWWWSLEQQVKKYRKTLLLEIALFLAQKGEDDDRRQGGGSPVVDDLMAGSIGGVQEEIRPQHLGAVRERNQADDEQHKQPGKVCQLALL